MIFSDFANCVLRLVQMDHNAVALISRDSRPVSRVSYYSEFERYDFASAFIKWAYIHMYVRTNECVFQRAFYALSLEGVSVAVASIARIPVELRVAIIPHVIESTAASHRRAFIFMISTRPTVIM